jgi:diguanylate cyclase (GGDEF)-like protein
MLRCYPGRARAGWFPPIRAIGFRQPVHRPGHCLVSANRPLRPGSSTLNASPLAAWSNEVLQGATASADPPFMGTDKDVTADRHISGMYSSSVIDFLSECLPADEVKAILERAGDTRGVDEISRLSSWSSYHQFRALLEEATLELARSPEVDGKTLASPRTINTATAEPILSFGSAQEFLARGDNTNPLIPIRRYDVTEVGLGDWRLREWFVEGFAPYPEFCSFLAGTYASIPTIFGLDPGEVTEEQCQCRGDDACVFRLRWVELDEVTSRANYLDSRARLLEARLEQLQAMVTDLASNARYGDVLQGIVRSSMEAVGATGALLVLDHRVEGTQKIYSEGLRDDEVRQLADDVMGDIEGRPDLMAVEVSTARRRYGVLAIGRHRGNFTSSLHATLKTYARLAGAALDAADAMEQARHQASTAQALLDLSASLAEIVSTEEMAAKVARAVPDVIDCDRVAVVLNDGNWQGTGEEGFRIAASYGYPSELVAAMTGLRIRPEEAEEVSEFGLAQGSFSRADLVANVSAPITTAAGETIGYIVVGVTEDAERLTVTARLAERLKGMAAQAAGAISNARLVDQIRFEAVHDALTGLPNRALILDRTEQMLTRARRTPTSVAALFIDLDGFKDVNDTLGHEVGDQLLRAVSLRLSAAMRESDSVGRLGGDEFVVLVDGAATDHGPEVVAERLLEVLRAPFELDGSPGGPLTMTASIGVALGTRSSAAELLRDADIALYEAKAAGKNCYLAFESAMHAAVQDRHLLESDLRDALANHQFFLVYQPIFNLGTGGTTGVEALLRWNHPDRGVVMPEVFIPILEDSGMITEVGRWVLDEACRQGARWHALGFQLDISVNVSARQLDADRLVEDVRCALAMTGFDASSLIVEITESAIMRNVEAAIPRMDALKAIGVRLAIDDFGTGYSSLAYLRQFPVDTIKIDRSFVASMSESHESGVLIRTLVQLGKTLGLETLAEGIEESEQYSQLEREECVSGQGFLYARPLEADAVAAFLARVTPKPVGIEGPPPLV